METKRTDGHCGMYKRRERTRRNETETAREKEKDREIGKETHREREEDREV